MSLSVYEKNNVKSGVDCLVKGYLSFNVLNQPRTQKPNEYVSDPKPEYVVSLDDPEYIKGDENLIKALNETKYGEQNNKLSIRDKSPFAPTIFGVDNGKQSGSELIPEGYSLKNGQPVLVHVTTYEGHGNVGCGFDAIKIAVPLSDVKIIEAGGSVSADVFDI